MPFNTKKVAISGVVS